MLRSWVIVAVIGAGLPGLAAAALYKCGNNFQDRPCDNPADQKMLNPSGNVPRAPGAPVTNTAPAARTPAPAAAAAASAATAAASTPAAAGPVIGTKMSCGRAGEHARLVAWKREGGATRDAQLMEVRNRKDAAEAAAVIHSVYAIKGSADDIRKAIEASCMEQGGIVLQTAAAQPAASAAAALPPAPAPAASRAAPAASRAAPAASGAR